MRFVKRTAHITPTTKEYDAKITDAIIEYLNGTFSVDNGQSVFPGQSVSFLVQILRSEGFQLPGRMHDQEVLFNKLGFSIVAARQKQNTKKGFGGWCTCVTV